MEDEFSDAECGTFPAADVNAELNPGHDKDFKEVCLSSEISTSRDIKQNWHQFLLTPTDLLQTWKLREELSHHKRKREGRTPCRR
ncbi:uncharacterized protein LOC120171229 isoform X2 [Hibiscus syriacus]|uniref:uncharacterized protein LOC120171229 isoform X2 n=1 Tax=Hibiscus syriacus TaxID=106335 RepID=UPI001920DB58|nr:uncharacterized protein LOC120171229 isoform X2 [Hibiscus syriacus]